MSKTLNEIRQKIDAIDNQVHDLLMERAALVSGVAEAKRREGLQVVQPAREARMIRRLLARHEGSLPEATVVRIWRELVGAVALLQTGLSVGVYAPDDMVSHYWDMAKNYFGSVVPMKKLKNASSALSAVREDETSFAVLPWPELDDASPWWVHLFAQNQGEGLSVICALPYGFESGLATNGTEKALVISKLSFLSSDDDYSFIGLELDSSVSRALITNIFAEIGLEALNVYSAKSPYHASATLYLVEVYGYIENDSQAMNDLRSHFSEKALYCSALGGYPAVPEFKPAKAGIASQQINN